MATLQNGSYFDGSNDWLDAATPAGANTTEASLVVYLKPDSGWSSETRFFQSSAGRCIARITGSSGGKYKFAVKFSTSALGAVVDVESTYSFTPGAWNALLFSYDSVAQTVHFYNGHTDVDDTGYAGRQLNTGTIDHSVEHAIGAAVDGNYKYPGGIGPLWMTNEYIDFSSSTNRNKFIASDGKPNLSVILDNGSGPTGTQPLFWMRDAYSAFETNYGSVGNFTVNGALTDEGTLPQIDLGSVIPMVHHQRYHNRAL